MRTSFFFPAFQLACGLLWASACHSLAQGEILFVSSPGNYRILTYDASGGPGTTFASFTSFDAGLGLAFGPDGRLYVSSFVGRLIYRFDLMGNPEMFASGPGLGGPGPMAFDHNGNLFVSSTPSEIYRIDPHGQRSWFATWPAVAFSQGLAFDRDGYLYAANTDNIMRFDPQGRASVFTSSGIFGPDGLAFDREGNLFASMRNNTIVRYDPQGQRTVFASTGLNYPRGLAFDSLGNLYVANSGNNTIWRFDPVGNGSLFASTGLSGPSYLAIVPEPSCVALALLAFSAVFLKRRATC